MYRNEEKNDIIVFTTTMGWVFNYHNINFNLDTENKIKLEGLKLSPIASLSKLIIENKPKKIIAIFFIPLSLIENLINDVIIGYNKGGPRGGSIEKLKEILDELGRLTKNKGVINEDLRKKIEEIILRQQDELRMLIKNKDMIDNYSVGKIITLATNALTNLYLAYILNDTIKAFDSLKNEVVLVGVESIDISSSSDMREINLGPTPRNSSVGYSKATINIRYPNLEDSSKLITYVIPSLSLGIYKINLGNSNRDVKLDFNKTSGKIKNGDKNHETPIFFENVLEELELFFKTVLFSILEKELNNDVNNIYLAFDSSGGFNQITIELGRASEEVAKSVSLLIPITKSSDKGGEREISYITVTSDPVLGKVKKVHDKITTNDIYFNIHKQTTKYNSKTIALGLAQEIVTSLKELSRNMSNSLAQSLSTSLVKEVGALYSYYFNLPLLAFSVIKMKLNNSNQPAKDRISICFTVPIEGLVNSEVSLSVDLPFAGLLFLEKPENFQKRSRDIEVFCCIKLLEKYVENIVNAITNTSTKDYIELITLNGESEFKRIAKWLNPTRMIFIENDLDRIRDRIGKKVKKEIEKLKNNKNANNDVITITDRLFELKVGIEKWASEVSPEIKNHYCGCNKPLENKNIRNFLAHSGLLSNCIDLKAINNTDGNIILYVRYICNGGDKEEILKNIIKGITQYVLKNG